MELTKEEVGRVYDKLLTLEVRLKIQLESYFESQEDSKHIKNQWNDLIEITSKKLEETTDLAEMFHRERY